MANTFKQNIKPAAKAAAIIAVTCFLASNPAFAQVASGLAKGTTALTEFKTWIFNIASIIGGIMCVVAGFKVMKGDKTMEEVTSLFVGGLIILVGPQVINYFTSTGGA